MKAGTQLIEWYQKNKRDLPWRKTRDPYLIWISEIILQQTRVEQGLPYYHAFAEAFPTVKHLAKASEEKVLKLWQGLGYYSRARNMHFTAKTIVLDYKGKFPDDYESIKKLKGIGSYTAAAITSFAFQQPYPVVDGNVYRFLSRFYGIKTPVNSPAAQKEFTLLAAGMMENKDPAIFNQAIMEFGAMQCRPQQPDCPNCIFFKTCYAGSLNKVNLYPVKNKKNVPRNRYFNYLFIRHKNNFYIRKREGNDIWKHLYDFPLIETLKATGPGKLTDNKEFIKLIGKTSLVLNGVQHVRHQLTHQTIHATFYAFNTTSPLPEGLEGNLIKINSGNRGRFVFPRLIENYLKGVFKEN